MNDINCVRSKPGKNKKNKIQTSLSVDNKKIKQKRARIIVRNVSYKANKENLREHFKEFGNITDMQLLKRSDGKLVGCAFIQFETVNQAAKAILKCTNKDFLGRQIFLDWAVGKDKYDSKKNLNHNNNNNEKISNDKSEISNTDNIKKEFINENEKSEDENEDNMAEESYDESYSDADDDAGSDEDEKEGINKKDYNSMKKNLSNDVKDGRTVFLKNVPFDAKNYDIEEICKKFGKIIYALINCDPISGHSKGTAFVRFETKESADLLLSTNKNDNGLILMDSILEVCPALSRNEVKDKNKLNDNCNKDLRSLYLAKEGLIMSGSIAAEGVSASDMAKRHKLEKIKAQILKNLNRFVSRNRLSIHNLPLSYDDEKLKKMIITHTKLKPFECRVMRENKPSIEYPNGKSKGFGFASFKTHEDALFVLRKLNNNPNVFGQKNRPIVAFSIEDKTVHNIKQKRLKKSQQNNPTFKNKLEKNGKNCIETKNKKELKNQANNKNNLELKDSKKIIQKINKNNDNDNSENFMGTSSKPGEFVRLRSNQKIKSQFKVHLKNVSKLKRLEKRKKEKLIHLKEKQNNKNDDKKLKIIKKNKSKNNESNNFINLIEKYKNLIDTKAASQNLNANNMQKKKSKWYKE